MKEEEMKPESIFDEYLRLAKIDTKVFFDILSSNINLIKDRFLKTLVKYASDTEKLKWQKLISDSGWSSHMMICCQK